MIRPYRPADAEAVLQLNADNVPEVGPMDAEKLQLLASISPYFRVVEFGGAVVGMLIGLTQESTAYGSPNFSWFCARHPRFGYVDRVALAASVRGQGWGPALYTDMETWARSQALPVMCAEVNTIPPNPRSVRFHELFGFTEVARCHPYGPDEEVAMFDKGLLDDGL